MKQMSNPVATVVSSLPKKRKPTVEIRNIAASLVVDENKVDPDVEKAAELVQS